MGLTRRIRTLLYISGWRGSGEACHVIIERGGCEVSARQPRSCRPCRPGPHTAYNFVYCNICLLRRFLCRMFNLSVRAALGRSPCLDLSSLACLQLHCPLSRRGLAPRAPPPAQTNPPVAVRDRARAGAALSFTFSQRTNLTCHFSARRCPRREGEVVATMVVATIPYSLSSGGGGAARPPPPRRVSHARSACSARACSLRAKSGCCTSGKSSVASSSGLR